MKVNLKNSTVRLTVRPCYRIDHIRKWKDYLGDGVLWGFSVRFRNRCLEVARRPKEVR